ncbi:MAG: hypothetical protein VX438_01260 [Planctomycetota bacterium]|nr:hypothetical protein [Planctomycetota bacterium]
MPSEWGPEKLAVAIHHTYPVIFHSDLENVAFNTPGHSRDAGWQTVATLSSLGEMLIFFGRLEETIPQLVHSDEELNDQSPDFLPQLIDAASNHTDHRASTEWVTVMFG